MESKKKTYRQKMAENTKRLILKTAIKLILKHGYENVTVSDIVEAASISRGSFYVHYKNKDDLLVESLFSLDEEYLEYYENELIGERFKIKDALELFELFILAVNRIFLQNGPELTRHYYSYAILNPDILTREDRHYFQIIKELLARCHEEDLLTDFYNDKQIAEMVLILNRGMAIDWVLADGAYPIESQDPLIKNFFKTIRKR